MLQADRNWLYNAAHALDNKPRIKIPAKALKEDRYKRVEGVDLTKLRIQGKTRDLYIIFSEAELLRIANDIRTLVANDERRLLDGVTHAHSKSY